MLRPISTKIVRFSSIPLSLVVLLLGTLGLQSCFKDLPTKKIMLEHDFERPNVNNIKVYGPGGLQDSTKLFAFNNSTVLGPYNNRFVLFQFDDMPSHNAVKVEFDLYLHDNWQGNYIPPGAAYPSLWQMLFDNNPALLTTFSNGTAPQSFPQPYVSSNPINNPALSDAWGVMPGYCAFAGKSNGSSHYKIDYTTSHIGSLQFAINDLHPGNYGFCDQSWSIDNLRITAILYK